MIRDPSDGSIREKPEAGIPASKTATIGIPITESTQPLIDTSTSGLPITKAKADYLARLEESRKWLESYVRPTITPGDNE